MKKMRIEVCVGTSCHLMGSNLIIDYLDNLPGEVKKHFDINYISCMERCEKGPRVWIDDKVLEKATPEDIELIIKKQL